MSGQQPGTGECRAGRRSSAAPWRWVHRAAALALVATTWTMGLPASPLHAADDPDLAIEVQSLPTSANPMLELKVTNLSPNTVATETQAQVVFQGGSPLIPGMQPFPTIVFGAGAQIESLNPGQSTTFSVETPVFYCIEYPQRAASMGLAPPAFYAIATLTPAKGPTGVTETNQSNNGLQILNLCERYAGGARRSEGGPSGSTSTPTDLAIEAISGPRETLLVPFAIPYDIKFRNDGSDLDGQILVEVRVSGVARIAEAQPSVPETWAEHEFTSVFGEGDLVTFRRGSLRSGESVTKRVFISFLEAGVGGIEARIRRTGSNAEDSDPQDDRQSVTIRVVRAP